MNKIVIETIPDENEKSPISDEVYTVDLELVSFVDDDPSAMDGEILLEIRDSFLIGNNSENIISRTISLKDAIQLREFLDVHIKNYHA